MARILIIDDNAQVRATVRQMLQLDGHEVLEAGDGDEGLRLYRQQPVPLVICDLFMPDREGLETIRELRRLSTEVRILAVSGGSSKGELDCLNLATRLGADVALRKPFDLARLREVLAGLLP
jgi:CheY-like chemotaxis protein